MKPSSGEYAPVEMQMTSQTDRSESGIFESDAAAAIALAAVAWSTVRSTSFPPCGATNVGLELGKRTSRTQQTSVSILLSGRKPVFSTSFRSIPPRDVGPDAQRAT